MKKSYRFQCMALALILGFSSVSMAQHPDGWDDFSYKAGPHKDGFPVYYELTRDYTIDLPSYFLDASTLPAGGDEDFRNQYYLVAAMLPPADWDFVRLEKGGILTVKKGYRWDGASRPCKPTCDDYDYHYRATLIHDALYDLMRLGYLEPDTEHWPERGELPIDYAGSAGPIGGFIGGILTEILEEVAEALIPVIVGSDIECYDDHAVDTPGDRNRRLADVLLYMISVEDGQETGQNVFFQLVRFGGACRTYNAWEEEGFGPTFNSKYVPRWKFYPSQLSATRAEDGIQLNWIKANAAGMAPDNSEYLTAAELPEHVIVRNDEVLVDDIGNPIVVSADTTSYLDTNVEDGKRYVYILKEEGYGSDPRYWSNSASVVVTEGSGNALRLGFDGSEDFIAVGSQVSNDLIEWDAEGWSDPFGFETLVGWALDKANVQGLYRPDGVTLEAWVMPEAQNDDGAIFALEYPPTAASYGFGSGSLYISYCGDESKFCVVQDNHSLNDPYVFTYGEDELPPEQWYHVAFTTSEDPQVESVLYVNGERQIGFYLTETIVPWRWANLNIGGAAPSTDLYDILANLFGVEGAGHPDSFKGLIDEARIWRAAKSAEEIQAGMCAMRFDDEIDLVSHWHFDNEMEPGDKSCFNLLSMRYCGAADATRNANHLRVTSAFPETEPMFVPSGAITPRLGQAVVELGDSGTGSIPADQLLTDAVNAICLERFEMASADEMSCNDLGANKLDVRITDKSGVTRLDKADVEVVDLMNPEVLEVVASHEIIRSRQDDMVKVTIDDVFVTDNCRNIGLASCGIASVTANEPLVSSGGPERPDYDIIDDLTVNLRATSSSRVYTLGVTCADASGNVSAPATVDVRVGRAQKGGGAMSVWFLVGLSAVVALRSRARRARM